MDTIDIRDSIAPFSLLAITRRCKRMDPGEALEIIANDASIAVDIERLISPVEYTITRMPPLDASRPDFRIRLKKKPTTRPPKRRITCLKAT